jgi:hypothetical protein
MLLLARACPMRCCGFVENPNCLLFTWPRLQRLAGLREVWSQTDGWRQCPQPEIDWRATTACRYGLLG